LVDRVKRHSRKLSNSLTKPLGYHSVVGGGEGTEVVREDSKYEMRALMDPSRSRVVTPTAVVGKMSGESYSFSGSDVEGDRDSGKGMVKLL
jgi:hypothetical protein